MARKRKRQLGGCLPNDVLLNILQRLPVKSLIRYQCAAKSLQSLITHPSFKLYSNSTSYSIFCYFCVVDDRKGPKYCHRIQFEPSFRIGAHDDVDGLDDLMKMGEFNNYQVCRSSNGLICYASCDEDLRKDIVGWGLESMHLWNPRFSRCKKVALPHWFTDRCSEFSNCLQKLGFGFCGINGFNDYKVVHVTFHSDICPESSSTVSYCNGHVCIYSLAFDSWKILPSTNVPPRLATFNQYGNELGNYAFVGGVHYWLTTHNLDDSYALVGFNLETETFVNNVDLPKLFRPSYVHGLYLFELDGTVALYEATDEFRKGCLWVCVSSECNWVKLFSIMVNDVNNLFMDERLPYFLQMMLKHDPKLKLNQDTYYYEGASYCGEHTRYIGTYVESLALLGVPGTKDFRYPKCNELCHDEYDNVFYPTEYFW